MAAADARSQAAHQAAHAKGVVSDLELKLKASEASLRSTQDRLDRGQSSYTALGELHKTWVGVLQLRRVGCEVCCGCCGIMSGPAGERRGGREPCRSCCGILSGAGAQADKACVRVGGERARAQGVGCAAPKASRRAGGAAPSSIRAPAPAQYQCAQTMTRPCSHCSTRAQGRETWGGDQSSRRTQPGARASLPVFPRARVAQASCTHLPCGAPPLGHSTPLGAARLGSGACCSPPQDRGARGCARGPAAGAASQGC